MVKVVTTEPTEFIPKRKIALKGIDVETLNLVDESGNVSDEIKKILFADGITEIDFTISYKVPSEEE